MLALAFIASLTLGASDTNVDTGQQLLRWLEETSADYAFMSGVANGFVQGEQDSLALMKVICLPPHWTHGQANGIVIKWIKDHPKEWQLSSSYLTMNALLDAWPCTSK